MSSSVSVEVHSLAIFKTSCWYNSIDYNVLYNKSSKPITARALPVNSMGIVLWGIAIEIFQFIYIGITAYILTRQGRIEPKQKELLR
jgi:hypothetical protein